MLSANYLNHFAKQKVRNINKHAALSLIQFTSGGVSRAELAKLLGVSRAAVTTIVNDLMQSGVIRESAKKTVTSGRPRTMLEITPEAGFVAGVDMGATHLQIVVADFGGNVCAENEIGIDIQAGPEACIGIADRFLREILQKENMRLGILKAIGVGVPGPVLSGEGIVVAPPIMPGWDRYPIRESFSTLWGIPVSVNNDAELGALGEWAYGAGREAENIAYIKVGTGIGAGLLLEGRIYQGATGSAGEIGHLTIDKKGPRCTCGNHGCLEAYSGGHAIARQARKAIERGRNTQLNKIDPEKISAQDVASAARRGDLVAQEIMREAGEHLGVAIAGLVNIFNPNMVIVGGGVARIGDLFLEPIRKTVEERSLLAATTNVRITTALLGKRASSMGAVAQAISAALYHIAEEN